MALSRKQLQLLLDTHVDGALYPSRFIANLMREILGGWTPLTAELVAEDKRLKRLEHLEALYRNRETTPGIVDWEMTVMKSRCWDLREDQDSVSFKYAYDMLVALQVLSDQPADGATTLDLAACAWASAHRCGHCDHFHGFYHECTAFMGTDGAGADHFCKCPSSRSVSLP